MKRDNHATHYYGPRRDNDPRWVSAVVLKDQGSRRVIVRVWPKGPISRRHVEQLRPRYGVKEDEDPGATFSSSSSISSSQNKKANENQSAVEQQSDIPERRSQSVAVRRRIRQPIEVKFDAQHPRRSTRVRKPRVMYQP